MLRLTPGILPAPLLLSQSCRGLSQTFLEALHEEKQLHRETGCFLLLEGLHMAVPQGMLQLMGLQVPLRLQLVASSIMLTLRSSCDLSET